VYWFALFLKCFADSWILLIQGFFLCGHIILENRKMTKTAEPLKEVCLKVGYCIKQMSRIFMQAESHVNNQQEDRTETNLNEGYEVNKENYSP